MTREIRIQIKDELTTGQYADLANAIWMVMRNTPYEFAIQQDNKTSAANLNAAWDQYGIEAHWT